MKMDIVRVRPITSSFLSSEKDAELIIKQLFQINKPYSDILKKLLVINTSDCLDNPKFDDVVKTISVSDLISEGYINLVPKIRMREHEELKSYIIITFDNFIMNPSNSHFRDCDIIFDILCPTDQWYLGDYRLRPMKIAGYIDGLLNNSKLTGIGILNFVGCNELVINENLSGYTLVYRAVHGSDDQIEADDKEE